MKSRDLCLACVLGIVRIGCGGATPEPRAAARAAPRAAQGQNEAPAPVSEPGGGGTVGIGVAGGGGGPAVLPGTPAVPAEGAPPSDVLAFVRQLMAARDPEQHDMIDWLRQSTIAGAVGVDDTTTSLPLPSLPQRRRGLPVGPPTGCVPAYTWSGGYEMLAMPPPLNGWPEPVIARVQQAIDYLQEGHEVTAWCTYLIDEHVGEDDDGNPRFEPRPTPGPAFVLNVFRSPAGWRIQAWSELRGQSEGAYPEP